MSKYKCYTCKKAIRLFSPVITFYSPTSVEELEDVEYHFCSEQCVNKFLKNRKQFWEIIKGFDDDGEEEDNED
jgi:MYM-type Zinc finger with FCS sequence motif